MPSNWLTVAQAAEQTQLSEPTIRRAIKSGALVAFRIGTAVRLRAADVDTWMTANTVRES